ncbi:hypothetical protein [Ramlibacter sp.]|uniref:hypothetical protein n=1 Tax=Ramlibacter sp. TaxID=1917967 RepID=UPI003D0D5A13
MVALVSSLNLGLTDASQTALGLRQGDPALGRGGEKAWVNTATGNLVLQQQDDFLAAHGPDIPVFRTYNSQGTFDGDNNDNWRIGFYRQVKALVGTVNTANSRVTRVDQDGSELVYAYDTTAAKYIRKDGDGSNDTLACSGTTWTWTDGASRLVETYDAANGGRLVSRKDIDLNTVTFSYNASSLLTSVTSSNGERVELDYSGNKLTLVRVIALDGATTLTSTRTRYAYDASDRLATVTVDLSPGDNAVADGATYVTTYTYDGASKRIAGIAQTDGTSVAFVYTQVGTTWRVASMTQVADDGIARTTTYSWDTASRIASVTDPLGNVARYTHDAGGRLVGVIAPAVDGTSQSTAYEWNANGGLAKTTDALGNETVCTYDANGNMTLSRDAAGNTVTQTWGTMNQLLTRTTWAVPDPDGAGSQAASVPLTSRYAYNAAGKLRWALSPEGRITEYQYAATGECSAVIEYVGILYPLGTMSASTAPSNPTMNTWRDALPSAERARTTRTDYVYDFRGQLSKAIAYQSVDGAGAGVASGARTTQYVYDPAGKLLQTIEAKGVASATANDFVTQHLYDGLGRAWKTIDSLGNVTLTQYDDASNKTTTTLASGLVTTRTFNRAGDLIAVAQGGAGIPTGTVASTYDRDGQLRRVIDARGAATYSLYDAAGRKVADIDALGALAEYGYDANDQVVRTTRYATPVSSALLSSLDADIAAGTNGVTLATVRPAAAAGDGTTRSVYDKAGRLVREIGELGAVTEYQYDGADRLLATLEYDQPLTGAGTVPDIGATFSRTRNFYDNDGLLVATLSPVGSLTENVYDAAGRLVKRIDYATATDSTKWASGTLAQLRPAAVAADAQTRWQYDASDRVTFEVDAAGAVTGYLYDANGNVVQERMYANAIAATASPDSVPADAARDRIVRNTYDNADRVSFTADALGTVTGYVYDAAGNTIRQTTYANAVSAATAPEAVVADAARDQVVTNVYDAAGRLTHSIDGLGAVTGFTYDARGQVTQKTTYANPATTALKGRYVRIYHNDQQAQEGYTSVISLTELEVWAGGVNIASGRPAVAGADTGSVNATYHAPGALTDGANKGGAWTGQAGSASGMAWVDGNTTGYIELDLGAVRSIDTIHLYGRTLTAADSRNLRIYVFDTLPSAATAKATLEADAGIWRSDASLSDATPCTFTQGPVAATSGNDQVTRYEYDAAGRQTKTIYPPVTVYTGETSAALLANGATEFARRTETTQTLYTQAFYDALGNIVANRDTAGNMRYQAWDAAGQLVYSVDAEGYATRYERDALGNVTVLTRYATKMFENAGWGTQAPSAQAVATQIVASSSDRQIRTDYDAMGRTVRVTEPQTFNVLGDGTTLTASPVTENIWDALGRLQQTRVLRKPGEWLTTTHHYDAQGRVVATLDSLGHLTTRSWDVFGNEVQRKEYATAAPTWTPGSAPPTSALDRTVTMVWDKANRKIAETRVDVEFASGASLVRGDLSYAFAYDAFGNLIRQTDATGALTRTWYDKANRTTAVASAQTAVLGNGSFTPLTEFRRDNFGNVVQQVAHASSAVNLGDAGYTVAASADDRIDAARYDSWGRAVDAVDALGNHQLFSYDSAGRLAKQWSAVTIGSGTVGNTTSTRFQAFLYDKLGRMTVSGEADSAGTAVVATLMKYNAFGEMTAGGVLGIDDGASEYMHYDNGGRLWRTNGGDGVAKVMQYDLQGRMTATLVSADTNLKSVADAAAAHALAGTFRTVNTWDALGRMTRRLRGQRPGLRARHLEHDRLRGLQRPRAFAEGQGGLQGHAVLGRQHDGLGVRQRRLAPVRLCADRLRDRRGPAQPELRRLRERVVAPRLQHPRRTRRWRNGRQHHRGGHHQHDDLRRRGPAALQHQRRGRDDVVSLRPPRQRGLDRAAGQPDEHQPVRRVRSQDRGHRPGGADADAVDLQLLRQDPLEGRRCRGRLGRHLHLRPRGPAHAADQCARAKRRIHLRRDGQGHAGGRQDQRRHLARQPVHLRQGRQPPVREDQPRTPIRNGGARTDRHPGRNDALRPAGPPHLRRPARKRRLLRLRRHGQPHAHPELRQWQRMEERVLRVRRDEPPDPGRWRRERQRRRRGQPHGKPGQPHRLRQERQPDRGEVRRGGCDERDLRLRHAGSPHAGQAERRHDVRALLRQGRPPGLEQQQGCGLRQDHRRREQLRHRRAPGRADDPAGWRQRQPGDQPLRHAGQSRDLVPRRPQGGKQRLLHLEEHLHVHADRSLAHLQHRRHAQRQHGQPGRDDVHLRRQWLPHRHRRFGQGRQRPQLPEHVRGRDPAEDAGGQRRQEHRRQRAGAGFVRHRRRRGRSDER